MIRKHVIFIPLQLTDVTDGAFYSCILNDMKTICTQVNIYSGTKVVVGRLTSVNTPCDDPCIVVRDHFEMEVELKMFLLQKMDSSTHCFQS